MFYPEDIEDLVIKKEDVVIEAIQIKNISSDLTLSSLSSTKSSKYGEGFFNRVCSLHALYPELNCIRVVYFNSLGSEFRSLENNDEEVKEQLLKKLTNNHGLTIENAKWLLSALIFEKVNTEEMENSIRTQLSTYVPVMAAPDLAKTLLVQHVSELSRTKGHTTLQEWQEKMHQIGTDIATIDGYYKEYQKSLIRLSDLTSDKNVDQLRIEFEQGIATQPSHIRNNLDLPREIWITKISEAISHTGVAIVRGVSGQGKTALCYRYLLNEYPEDLVFCVRSISSVGQAENLVAAIRGIAKHTQNMVIYIDVNSGELQWWLLVQELQARGVSVPVLLSIRDEDFNMTQINGSVIQFKLVEVELSKQEARNIYENYTSMSPHQQLRSFEEAWSQFGEQGPLIEFAYLLTNKQPLRQRIKSQVNRMLQEGIQDSWLGLLHLVCYAGQTGCPLHIHRVKKEVKCDNLYSAINRLSNEYLIRTFDDNQYIEPLHPLRAQIICEVLRETLGEDSLDLVLSAIKCMDSAYIQLFLMDFFSKSSHSMDIIEKIVSVECPDWISYAGKLKTMLWLDVKRYVEQNKSVIDDLIAKNGDGWPTYMPMDFSGMLHPNKIIAEDLLSIESLDLENVNKDELLTAINEVKESLTSLQMDYQTTDFFITHSKIPVDIPNTDTEWSLFGYALFWLGLRGHKIELTFFPNEFHEKMLSGDIQSKADAICGLYMQKGEDEYYKAAIESLNSRIVEDYCVINFCISDSKVKCHFVPPLFDDTQNTNNEQNFNHYWKIKLYNVLKRAYYDKEYIEIELLGVDLLDDLGIDAINHTVCIPKSNRYDDWITEVNSWIKSRIDYHYRPETWKQYVSRIDELRKVADTLVTNMISCFDHLYKKQYLDKGRWTKVVESTEKFKVLTFSPLLLPKSVVDPYCLFREDMNSLSSETQELERVSHLLSYSKYKMFRKGFSDVYRHLENFLNQYSSILLARINKKNLDEINNPRLALINLFFSANALVTMQEEYMMLFKNYGTLGVDFNQRELDNYIILLNMWAYINENPIKGYAIAYDAKQRYRKSHDSLEVSLQDAINKISARSVVFDEHTYLIIPFDGEALEDKYTKVALTLRESYKSAIEFASERWYLETYDPNFIVVYTHGDIPVGSGFLLPIFRILDTPEDEISASLFPAELPKSTEFSLHSQCDELALWTEAIGFLSGARILIKQYNNVLKHIDEDIFYSSGIIQYINDWWPKLSDVLEKFSDAISKPLDIMVKHPTEMFIDFSASASKTLDKLQTIGEKVSSCESLTELEDEIINFVIGMILLQPELLSLVEEQ
ncbi:hypothetical protein [Paenibacillus azoreducens]|uniref:Uncharacterized protein n=1 Tax=Paenibacillus azoreducens TaxID=116718 RepID=A0A920CRW5_9BACL|nr:hypothetical protein [Paenibacillus azoreducens]GIO46828.1 hypothetical protein J34TS1_15930 [Paenibacillus azoreducens]